MAIWLEATQQPTPPGEHDGALSYTFGFLDRPLGSFRIDPTTGEVTDGEILDPDRYPPMLARLLRVLRPQLQRGEIPDTVTWRA